MRTFWMFLYNTLFIPLFWAALRLLGLVNAKVRRGIRGRDGLFERLATDITKLQPGPRIWFHSSSLGEFEQAKPIIAALKERFPGVRIIVTFFSPSGYEHSRTYPLADVISYIAFDSRRGARRFLDLVRPDLSVMVRYDIWPNHIWELRQRSIPIIIANATMSRHTLRRLPLIRSMHNTIYESIDTILAVAQSDVEAFGAFSLRHPHVEAIGDTRYDQVAIRSAGARKRSIVSPAVLQGKQVLVAGSTWPEDESVLLPAFLEIRRSVPDLLLILVPHEPTLEHIEDVERDITGQVDTIRFSALNEYSSESVIIVDSIGILLVLYAYAHLAAAVASASIHNVLRPRCTAFCALRTAAP
jgi:3-deoxy-D-manno-octulosonic-acid transferase